MLRLLTSVLVLVLLSLSLTSAPTQADDAPPYSARLALTTTPTATPVPPAQVIAPDWVWINTPGVPSGSVGRPFCLDALRCWFGGSFGSDSLSTGTLVYTGDGGSTWHPRATAFRSGFAWLRFQDEQIGVSSVGTTQDGGRTWEPFTQGGQRLAPRFVTDTLAYACDTQAGGLLRTVDRGKTWNRWSTNYDVCRFMSAGQFLDENVAWSITGGRALNYTTNGWKDWVDVEVGRDEEVITDVHFADFSLGWASVSLRGSAVAEGVVYRTRDGGRSWTRVNLQGGVVQTTRVFAADGRIAYVVGYLPRPQGIAPTKYDMRLYRTADAGATWEVELEGSSEGCVECGVDVGFLSFSSPDSGWASVFKGSPFGCCNYKIYRRAPGLALTPTATPTATPTSPPTTSTPTRTPFAPFLPTATPTSSNPKLTPTPSHTPGPGTPTATPLPPAITCEWSGQWAANASGEAFTMTLNRQGNLVDGTYHGDRRLSGFAEGNRLAGRWAGPPSFSEPLNAGRFEFTVAADCQSFTGTWGFGASAIGGGAWSGQRVATQERLDMVRAAYLAVLGREADPTGLHYWAGITLARFNIEAALGASEEGQRVAAVRALYRDLLLRDPLGPDNAGLRSWVDSPLTLEAIRAAWGAEPEVQRVLAIRALYRELLGRDDDLPGIRYWASSPLTLEQLRIEFMNSDEYRRRHGG